MTGADAQPTGYPTPLAALCAALRASRGFAHKRDLPAVMARIATAVPPDVAIGDDCAVLADPAAADGSRLLFAIDGFVEDFVERMPWFAGWCGVMVNLSDVYAMGGRPIAVVDAQWSSSPAAADPVLQGLADAAARYGVPLVGGHSNHRASRGQLAVAVLGRARRLLSSFDARPGDRLLVAVDLRGTWQHPYPYWNAATAAPAERLRGDLELLPALAEDGLAAAAKDISMAGVVGTTLMLLECSRLGATLDLDALPRPRSVALADHDALLRWLTAFPSYGFVLAVPPGHVAEVQHRFTARGLACAEVGGVEAGSTLSLRLGAETHPLWDHGREPFITAPWPGAPAQCVGPEDGRGQPAPPRPHATLEARHA